jgi:hypothetical protein
MMTFQAVGLTTREYATPQLVPRLHQTNVLTDMQLSLTFLKPLALQVQIQQTKSTFLITQQLQLSRLYSAGTAPQVAILAALLSALASVLGAALQQLTV